ncbi:MAG: hypothetical protein AB1744_09795, partial [Candidatus Zixiibacteriota bacterium]
SNAGQIWPAFEYVEGADTVTHVIARESGGDALYYFRKVGVGAAGAWDHPPYCIDSVGVLAHDLEATDDGSVALFWAGDAPGGEYPDQDLYVEISTDYGQTFAPRINVTNNPVGVSGFRPFSDLSGLISSDGVVHVVYGCGDFDASTGTLYRRGRFFHWDNSLNTITTAVAYQWDPTTCNGGAWSLNAAKMSLSECDGRMYILFTQFGDPEITLEDCSTESAPEGAEANGDLYLTVSDDWGRTWDKPRNITNTHTPGCDTIGGINGPCESEHWSSMVRMGTNYSGIFPLDAVLDEVDLGGQAGEHAGYYLDAQYIGDPSAGGAIQGEGWWQLADVRWIRIPCLQPIRAAQLFVTFTGINYPSWSKHGVQHDTTGAMEGGGNDSGNVTATDEEVSPASDWLGVSPTSWRFGPGAIQPLTISINKGGIINNPGTVQHLVGRLIFTWGGDNAPPSAPYDTVAIEHWVADTLVLPVWDTIATSCTKLAVSNHGNAGHAGAGKVNLDYVELGGDCTGPAQDPNDDIPDADIYLYDASPFVCYVDGSGDTTCSWSIFGATIVDTNSFRPLGGQSKTDSAGAQKYYSGVFVTNDSLIAVEKTWYAPTTGSDSCSFVVQRIKIYINDDAKPAPTGVRIGEALDWDVPADTNSRNSSYFDAGLKLVYQQGSEEDLAGCQPNDNRWAGIAFLDGYYITTDTTREQEPHGGATYDNPTYVYPLSGFWEDTLYQFSGISGYVISDSANHDLHTVMTYDTLATLTSSDTLVYYVLLATHLNGDLTSFKAEVQTGIDWYCNNLAPQSCGCCENRGNVD